MARKGVRVLNEPGEDSASAAWRAAVNRVGVNRANPAPSGRGPARATRPEQAAPAAPDGESGGSAGPSVFPRRKGDRRSIDDRKRPDAPPVPRRRERKLPGEVGEELVSAAGPSSAPKLEQRLAEATRAYERDRYQDALRILRPLADMAPGAPAVRELYGLTLYRLGRWRDAVRELTAFHQLSGSFDQHPVLADCRRALKQYRMVDKLWEELRQASPAPEVVAEGRLVVAGSLADRGDLGAAIAVLERHARSLAHPRLHHLRTWYALGDLYERAGDLPRARDLFRRVLEQDPELFDVAERLSLLGR